MWNLSPSIVFILSDTLLSSMDFLSIIPEGWREFATLQRGPQSIVRLGTITGIRWGDALRHREFPRVYTLWHSPVVLMRVLAPLLRGFLQFKPMLWLTFEIRVWNGTPCNGCTPDYVLRKVSHLLRLQVWFLASFEYRDRLYFVDLVTICFLVSGGCQVHHDC